MSSTLFLVLAFIFVLITKALVLIHLSLISLFRFSSLDGDELVSHSGGGSVGD